VKALRARLTRLPKTELHLHVLGALRPATLLELARRRNSPLVPAAERGAAEGYAFDHLPAFVEFFVGLFPLLSTGEDFERATFEVLEDAACRGVRYAELRWTPTSHVARGADEEAMFAGIASGSRAAEGVHGIVARHVVDFPRGLGPDVAAAATALALRRRGQGVVALDVAGDERAVAADPRFAPLFARARAGGLHALAHAGEGAGPESVAASLDLYGARRIGHGTRSVEDPALVARLAREGIVLEVCPTSNEALKVVPSVALHPVRDLLRAGVRCVVSSDDPTLFGTDVVREHERLHAETGIGLATLGRMAATGFDAALLEPGPSGEEARVRLAAWRDEALAWAAAEEAACA
jgi:adenosine deaminase